MSENIHLECPECGRSETTSFINTFALGFEASVDVTITSCAECGYSND